MKASNNFAFGTKAETLSRLAQSVTSAVIPESYFFSVQEWSKNRIRVHEVIRERFAGRTIAIRSSALSEDCRENSMAGAFQSKLNIDSSDRVGLEAAIDEVVRSMPGNPRDQVLVQAMMVDVAVSGVIMTYDMVHGAPYYCIDFDDETGRTDMVTSGSGVHKSLFVYRNAHDGMIRSARIAMFLRLARELESICSCAALDIEFGLSRSGQLVLFQVRRITLARNWHPVTERRVKRQLAHVEDFIRNCSGQRVGMLGDRTILAIMPDWNPAEIIGTTPRPLAASLYRELITSGTWCRARASMGYRDIGNAELMAIINSHPYVDVRNSFNSFLPSSLPDVIGEKLVNAWLNRLESFPELHDKIEFEIVPTCIDFCFLDEFKARYPNLLDDSEFDAFVSALGELTRRWLSPGPDNSLELALSKCERLDALESVAFQESNSYLHLERAKLLLDQCRDLGTTSFAVVARHAFIAEGLLRSAIKRNALTEDRVGEFKRSVETVTGSMLEAYAGVCNGKLPKGEFYRKYGHLRPGTYEITSLRYDEREDLFLEAMPVKKAEIPSPFFLTNTERSALDHLLEEADLAVVDADQLLAYARRAIAGREYVKFVFTRSLSDALSEIVRWGESHGLSREDLSYVEWPRIANSLCEPVMDDVDRYYLEVAEQNRRNMSAAYAFRLGHIIFGVRDIYVATLNRSVPNFVGIGATSGRVVNLDANMPTTVNIKGHIVCIENADPGFDWIFTKDPKGLITRFGGANSHMAVRCAEFGLPAAIGCGDQIYQRVVSSGHVELNCAQKWVRPVHVD